MTGHRGRSRKQQAPNRAPMDSGANLAPKGVQLPIQKRKRGSRNSNDSLSPPASPDTPMLNNTGTVAAPINPHHNFPGAAPQAHQHIPHTHSTYRHINNAEADRDDEIAAAAAMMCMIPASRPSQQHHAFSPAAGSPVASDRGRQATRKTKGQPRPLKQGLCSFCGETWSPMWRKGPEQYPRLCNACGMRYSRKQMNAFDEKHKIPKYAGTPEGQASPLLPGDELEIDTDNERPGLHSSSPHMAAAAGTEAAAAGWKADAAPLYSHGSLLGAFDAPAAAADEQPETPTAAAAASGDVSALPSAGGQAGAARANSRRNRRATAKAAAMQEGPLGPRRGRGRPRRTEEAAGYEASTQAALRGVMAALEASDEEEDDAVGTEVGDGNGSGRGNSRVRKGPSRLARTTFAQDVHMGRASQGRAAGLSALMAAADADMADIGLSYGGHDEHSGEDVMSDDSSGLGALAEAGEAHNEAEGLSAEAQHAAAQAVARAQAVDAAFAAAAAAAAPAFQAAAPNYAQVPQHNALQRLQPGASGVPANNPAVLSFAPPQQQLQQLLSNQHAQIAQFLQQHPGMAGPAGLLLQAQMLSSMGSSTAAQPAPHQAAPANYPAASPAFAGPAAADAAMINPGAFRAAHAEMAAALLNPVAMQQQLLQGPWGYPMAAAAMAINPTQLLGMNSAQLSQILASQMLGPQLTAQHPVASVDSDGTNGA